MYILYNTKQYRPRHEVCAFWVKGLNWQPDKVIADQKQALVTATLLQHPDLWQRIALEVQTLKTFKSCTREVIIQLKL